MTRWRRERPHAGLPAPVSSASVVAWALARRARVVYVLGGRIRLLLGEGDLILKAGEAAEFSTWAPHWIGAVDAPADVLALMGPQGERVHLRSP
jgi:hypothetical protein